MRNMTLSLSLSLSLYIYIYIGVPHTGRMHQIRVHLQWLGFPIVDDPIYNHEAWGTDRGIGGVTDELALKVSRLGVGWGMSG